MSLLALSVALLCMWHHLLALHVASVELYVFAHVFVGFECSLALYVASSFGSACSLG
jgi:hypothetical protein